MARDRLTPVKDEIRRLRSLCLSCGKWDTLLEMTRTLHSVLDELEIHQTYVEDDGDHDRVSLPRSLVAFASRFS